MRAGASGDAVAKPAASARRRPATRGPQVGTPARAHHGDPVHLEGVRISNPRRPIPFAAGFTKLDLVRYHVDVASMLLREISSRPLGVIRCPGGEIRTCFYQRHANPRMPDAQPAHVDASRPWLHLPTLQDVVRAIQNGAFEFHSWSSTLPDVDRPDRLVLDLDPDAAMAWQVFRTACEHVRTLLDSLELRWFVKTTGGKGLHFVLPLERRYRFDDVKAFARAIATRLTEDHPSLFLAHAAKAERKGRVFVDYLRNAEGATAVAAYSARARPGLPVSMPVAWDELGNDVRGAHFNVGNVPALVGKRTRDPWATYETSRQRLSTAQRRALGVH